MKRDKRVRWFDRLLWTTIGIAVFSGMSLYASGDESTQGRAKAAATAPANNPSTAAEKGDGASALQQRKPRYELCKGDSFDLTFPFTPEFNQTVTVQPDGYITLAGLGDLYVAGKTVSELRNLVQDAYGKTLNNPVVNIVLKDFQKPYFIASGELAHPGKYEMREDTTLTEAIAIAGGFTSNSKHSEVLLFRRVSNNWVQIKRFDVKSMFKAGNLAEDLHLQSGDMFFVPQNRMSKVGKYIPNPGVGMTVTRY